LVLDFVWLLDAPKVGLANGFYQLFRFAFLKPTEGMVLGWQPDICIPVGI
jgi:hypothetical protein